MSPGRGVVFLWPGRGTHHGARLQQICLPGGALGGRCTCGQAGIPIDGARLQQIYPRGAGDTGVEGLGLAGPFVDCASRISVGESTGGDERWPLLGRMDAERSCHWRGKEGRTWPAARKR